MTCENCTKDFEPKSAKAKFCSPKCRVYANRNKPATIQNTENYDWLTKPFLEAEAINPNTKTKILQLLDKIKIGLIK